MTPPRVRVVDLETGRELPAKVLPRAEEPAPRRARRPRAASRAPAPRDPVAHGLALLKLTPAAYRGPLILGALLAAVLFVCPTITTEVRDHDDKACR